jgi:hypothetical protein
LQKVRLESFDFLDHTLEFSPTSLIHLHCYLNGDQPDIRVLIEERWCNQLLEHNMPIPSLVIDSKFLNHMQENLKSSKDDSPLNLIR